MSVGPCLQFREAAIPGRRFCFQPLFKNMVVRSVENGRVLQDLGDFVDAFDLGSPDPFIRDCCVTADSDDHRILSKPSRLARRIVPRGRRRSTSSSAPCTHCYVSHAPPATSWGSRCAFSGPRPACQSHCKAHWSS